jgi:DNA-binding NarL/FixJ family response regulator
LLLDAALAGYDSHHLLQNLRKDRPELRIIVMDLLPSSEEVAAFVEAGVSGLVLKEATIVQLVATIRSVARGVHVLPASLTDGLLTHIAADAVARRQEHVSAALKITKREREVVDLIVEGLGNREIAQRLHIGERTVKSHVHGILEKLALRTRLQMAAYFRRKDSAQGRIESENQSAHSERGSATGA